MGVWQEPQACLGSAKLYYGVVECEREEGLGCKYVCVCVSAAIAARTLGRAGAVCVKCRTSCDACAEVYTRRLRL